MADQMKQEEGTAPAPAETINIIVRDQSGGEVHFKVKPHTKFTKVFDAYCSKKAIVKDSIKFLFDGQRIGSDQSPRELDMSDGDMVDAVIEQLGGYHPSN
ncbi:hypothetical protein CEUSTIGMA_g12692.t1 [Chlamydomonas eustigma]|uniref:Small ubiquitin-related modifier n=1 Tax=Chlamydomonas eustigma TaxID=1157962 RepID=A0A250XQH4_9CHLO|nr:hypothetical protein CEUSTIGMA_g1198.t1 [Chlamydomonas eustigma]GAX85273.1 hypothetical protein CEUSTIGMA_g12692.t1 [Chlamydomonas eustigma]|eukprot:GAX73746.1 hypothetical protein CEUSTIGMA_g1198.t1 [Chlamydomonas eustigma]